MATSREERMQQRMRGAGRHEVANDSFAFVLPVAESSPDPPSSVPQLRSEPNTSAKRRQLVNSDPGSPIVPPSSSSVATRSSPRLSSGQKTAQANSTTLDVAQRAESPKPNSPPATTTRISARLSTLDLNQDGTPRNDANSDAHHSLPAIQMVTEEPLAALDDLQESQASEISIQSMLDLLEEVAESPVTAPGSGRRRRIEPTDALTQSTKLQRAVMAAEVGINSDIATSSPLARKARQSTATAGALSARATRPSIRKTASPPAEAPHGSSPLARHSHTGGSIAATDSARSTRSKLHRSPLNAVILNSDGVSSPLDATGNDDTKKSQMKRKRPQTTIAKSPYEIGESEDENQGRRAGPQSRSDDEEAEEIDNNEAARRIGRKRPRISPRRRSSPDEVNEADSLATLNEPPAKKRRPRQTRVSPAKQSQPKGMKEKKRRLPTRQKGDGTSIPVTVQRYTKPLGHNDGDADDDILNADIPFTDHKSPNVIDVVLQMCEESMDKYLSTLQEEASQTEGSASRKIYRVKLRVVEAFQEELRTRLQAQTIALDHLRTLKKRVRAAQKEKLMLRNEILRIRAEREQVSLKIDAVRIRHEAANEETLYQLGLSSTMDDVELAIENGRLAPELNAKEQKMAELANLDLLISQITNQVSVGEAGGILKQIKDFNMFLERAATALEGR